MALCRRSIAVCVVVLLSWFLAVSLVRTERTWSKGALKEMAVIEPNVTDAKDASKVEEMAVIEPSVTDAKDASKVEEMVASEPTMANLNAFCRCSQTGGDFPPVGLEMMGEAALKQLLEEMRRELRMFIYQVDFYCAKRRTGMNRAYMVEWLFYDIAKSSPLRVKDDEKATIFYMPTFAHCWRDSEKNRVKGGIAAAMNLHKMLHSVSKFPFFQRYWGKKHFWISTHDMGKQEPLYAWCANNACSESSRDLLEMLGKNGTVLTITADDLQMQQGGKLGEYGFNSSLDVSLVCNGDVGFASRSKSADPKRARPYSVFFAGKWQESWIPLRYTAIRSIQQANLSKPTSFKPKITPEAYEKFLKDSELCLAPRGTRVQSPRLFEMIWFGCIPVIIADGYHLPSSCFFDWREFSIRIEDKHAHKAGEILKVYLDDPKRLQRFRDKLFQIRQHFMWHKKETPGDAFELAMLDVYLKQQRQC